MNDLFVWKDGYSIGVEEVDAQHKNLFRMASRLQDHLPPGELEAMLMELYRHSREHFKSEEALMRDSGYPYYLEHRGQHDALLDDLNRMAAELVKDLAKLPTFRDLVADWVKKHILNHDQGSRPICVWAENYTRPTQVFSIGARPNSAFHTPHLVPASPGWGDGFQESCVRVSAEHLGGASDQLSAIATKKG